MFGRIIGALAGAQVSKHTNKIGGTGGALLGALAVPMVARLSVPALLAVGVGGYFAKRAYDKRHQPEKPAATQAKRSKAKAAAA